MSERESGEGLLSGYRVLDLTDEKGLLCGKILGDRGADVIKIERPGGDPARNIGPFYKDTLDPQKSLFWFYTNTNKRGITLNIETADGRDILRRLVKTAHFVIESYEPGYMDRLGLGYSDLEKINPGIVMTSITPFGQTGPHAHYKANDLVLWNMGGMSCLCGDPDRAPVRLSCPQAYFQGGLQGALGSMVAHYHRVMTGEGQHVDVSIQEAVIFTTMAAVEIWDMNRVTLKPSGPFYASSRPAPLGPLYNRWLWPCKDGHVVLWYMGGANAAYSRSSKTLIEVANREGFALELKGYNWFEHDKAKITQEQEDQVCQTVMPYLQAKTKAELFEVALREGVLLAPANTTRDLAESLQLASRDYWVDVEHAELGESISYPGATAKVGDAPWRIRRRAPLVGEHNEQIYSEELGFSPEDLALLKAAGVI